MGRPIDVIETSRGCTFDCSFCSIIEMRGRNFHRLPIDRVIADIRDARDRGARAIFIVDDNITIDVPRFEALCRAIVDAGLDDIHYLVQAMTASIAQHGETLAPLMYRAGFRYVFLGIENILEDDLAFLKAAAKNTRRGNDAGRQNATMAAIDVLHRHGMFVVGGLIVGNPDDTQAAIDANLTFARKYVDWPYIQHPTPYPGTPMTKDFRERGLIVNTRVDEYDGTSAVTRSAHLEADEIEYLRWRADRWMKVRHMPAAMRLYPGFIIRHARRMMAHTFRGTTWRTGPRPRELTPGVSTIQADTCTRAHLSGLARSRSVRPRCRSYIGHFAETRVRSEARHFRHADRQRALSPALGFGNWALGVDAEGANYVFPGDRQDLDERHARGLG